MPGEITPDREVAGFLWVPLSALLDETNWSTAPIAIRTVGIQDRPVFRYADYLVWGMTEGAPPASLVARTRDAR